jgi:uncharacterized membrane-anchored protein YitT (DUF2179 family)
VRDIWKRIENFVVIFKTFFLICGVLVVSVKIDLVATSLFLLLVFIIIINIFASGFRCQRRRSIIARRFWK